MFATGARKDNKQRRLSRYQQRQAKENKEAGTEEASEAGEKKPENTSATTETSANDETAAQGEGEQKAGENKDEGISETEKNEDPRQTLKQLLTQAKNITADSSSNFPAKRRYDIYTFRKNIRSALARTSSSQEDVDDLESQFRRLKTLATSSAPETEKASTSESPSSQSPSESSTSTQSQSPSKPTPTRSQDTEKKKDEKEAASANDRESNSHLASALQEATHDPNASLEKAAKTGFSDDELEILREALRQLRENPIDHTKPYATPWRPREYMSAFAFIPRYLEVNQNICAAVYLRHPVARPGMSEVPTPYDESIMGAAFAWYLRRR